MNTTYLNALDQPPAPGSGCHPHLLRIANIGIRDGIPRPQLAADIRAAIPPGTRHVPDSEIDDAITKAAQDAGQYMPRQVKPVQRQHASPSARRPKLDADKLRAQIMACGSPDEVKLVRSSPVHLHNEDETAHVNTLLLLQHLYKPGDHLYLGSQHGSEVMTANEWYIRIQQEGTYGLPHITPNPLTGEEHLTKSGKPSRRCDAAVKEFRYAVCECDDMCREDQISMWSGWIKIPELPRVACLIDSGGKSIHAWLEVRCPNSEKWEQEVELGLFPNYLVPLGGDPACRNESRMSRLPGHFRTEKGRWQRLLWLNTPSQSQVPAPICTSSVTDATGVTGVSQVAEQG